jgi:murein DD-endopeptidase MepM/ murein hydrolase activator NlpD
LRRIFLNAFEMKTSVLTRLILAVLFAGTMAHAGTESGEMLSVTTAEVAGITHFFVQNLAPGYVTATFNVHSKNLQANVALPFTITLAGDQLVDAITLTPIKADQPWKYNYTRSSVIGSATAVPDESVYLLPYAAGASFPVSQGYHGKFSHFGPDEYAIDWKMPEGTPIHAARGGLVVQSRDNAEIGGKDRKYECCANCILIQHDDGTVAVYGHLQKSGNRVKVGDRVKAGDWIGLSGNTGFSSGPHLHFAVFTAKDGMSRASLPVKFQTAKGVAQTLADGKSYQAAPLGTALMATVKIKPPSAFLATAIPNSR